MNNYCIHLKKRKNKPFCKLLNKEITFAECSANNSANDCKTYKTKIDKNSFYKEKMHNKIKNTVQNSNHTHNKKPVIVQIKKKSSKLAKLERNRYSVFTDDLNQCFLCEKDKEELHEIFAGRNRKNSMKYGFVLPLCHECHSLNQNNPFFNDYWHKKSQEYWICIIGTREEFIKLFGRNYLK